MSQLFNCVASGLFLAASALVPTSSAFARDAQGGVLTFSGEIVESACSIDRNAFMQSGQASANLLTGCSQHVATNTTVGISGMPSGAVMYLNRALPSLVMNNSRVVLQLEYL
ncbi:type 1 fimbrial protein [Jeongeupia chitinilytica]|uniref:Type 1 fimbrial protein n=1 Tax=Jeongeupia chitinilytica TaxID=1041641 RepID=A0ABQ3H164_9NEIS|nr:type 1 fimbrial protein [Jeongeupia chitinilytica]GHD62787.1 hypothetical protein GCM10007350_19010 [Jeongeupia chitinilytica]